MKATPIILLRVIFIGLLISCDTTHDKTFNDNKMVIVEIKKHLEYQEKVESDEKEFSDPYKLSEKDLMLALYIENEGLLKNGFVKPDKVVFETKMVEIFGIRLDSNICSQIRIRDSLATYFDAKLDGTINTLYNNEFELVSITNNIFFSRTYNFFTNMYLLKELIIFNKNGYNLSTPQILIARNKYLLNDTKSLLPWLTINDELFMKSLLTKFGYTKDKELLKWIVRNNMFIQKSKDDTNGIDFGHILYSRDCNGKIKIHKEVFDVMETEMSAENPIFLDNLLEYNAYLSNSENDPDLTFEERAEIIANILYFGQDLANNKGYGNYKFQVIGLFQKHNDIDKYEEEFKQKEYYGLRNYKEIWQEAIYEGVGTKSLGDE